MLEIKQLMKLGVEEADRITKRGKWLPSLEEWKKWVVCTALSSASQKIDLQEGEKRFGGPVKLNIRENI